MEIDIEKLIATHGKKTKADIIDTDEMRVTIPVLLREISRLKNKLSESEDYIATLETKKPPLERKGESGKAKWHIKYDVKKNRLYIGLEGIYNIKSAKIASNAILLLIEQAKKDYDVVNDISRLEAVTDLKVLFHIRKVIFSVKQSGVGRIVRVGNPKNKAVAKLFGEGSSELNDTVTTFKSLAEADKYLDNRESFLKQ